MCEAPPYSGVAAVSELCVVLAGVSKWLEGTARSVGGALLVILTDLLVFLPRVPMAKHALTALDWSCIAACYQKPPSSSLLLSQGTLLTAASSTKLWSRAVKKLSLLWAGEGELVEEMVTAVLEGSPSPPSLLLLSLLARFCREHSQYKLLWEEKKVCDLILPHSYSSPLPLPPFLLLLFRLPCGATM